MDLTQFNSLAIDTPKDAVNFINLLIDFFPKESNKGKAILGVYDAFSNEIKSDETIFNNAFYKFFLSHKITKENSGYYEKFSKYWSDSENEDVKKNNPHWAFPNSIFKDAVEFAKSLKNYNAEPFENTNKFLKTNKDEISRLISISKNKFSSAMLKHKGWSYLFANNYDFFNNLCDEYKYDKRDIVKSLMGEEESFGLKKIIDNKNTDPKSIEFILNNIDSIFKDSYFFTVDSEDKEENYSISDTFLTFVLQGKNEFAFKLVKEHREKLNECLYGYMFSFGYSMDLKKADITKDETWKQLISILDRVHNFKESAYYAHNFTIKPFKEAAKAIQSIPKIIEYEEMKATLNKEPSIESKKRVKI